MLEHYKLTYQLSLGLGEAFANAIPNSLKKIHLINNDLTDLDF